jgi:hypothetical protein
MALLAVLLILAQELDPLVIDEKAGQVTFGAKVLKTDVHPQLKGCIEYLITMPGGKSYESCFETGALDALKLYLGLQKIGAAPGKPAAEGKPAEGCKLRITVEWKDGDKPRKEPIESFVHDDTTQKRMEKVEWIFSGSKGGYVPETDREGLLVLSTKNLMGLYQGDATPLITNPTPLMTGNRYKVNKALLPKEGTPVKIIIEVAK